VSTTYADDIMGRRVRDALTRIAAVRDLDGRTVIDVPIMYPSGATAVVDISRNGDRYWVSDMGRGHVECEMSGAESFYGKIASRVADDFGIGFDGDAMFALWVTSARLESAIVCVANASSQASSEAVRQAIDTKLRAQNERIFERIRTVFGEQSVARSVDITGRHASWEARNVVVFSDRRKAIFEHMTSHPNSVSSKFLMFTDIKSADLGISLNAMVRDIRNLDEKAQMIADVGNIIQMSATDEQIIRYARAA